MYPGTNPVFGIFVKEQIDEIEKIPGYKNDVYFINASEKGNFRYIVSILAIPLKIIKGGYDIIHIHYGLSALFLLFYRPKTKVYLTLHGADILKKQGKTYQVYLTKRILKKVDKVFILNKEMEEIVKPLGVSYETVPCGVNTDFFKPLMQEKKDDNYKLIVFPGNPALDVKNFFLFESVLKYLKKKTSFVINYQCINNLSREGVRDLLNKANCLLMTSISEGSPQVIKEALSCGLPVVSVPVGDVNFMVEQVPGCYVSDTYIAGDLGLLVLKAFGGDRHVIRNAFINKHFYDNGSVINKLIKNYESLSGR